jgi:MoaA/NifB/PqqE/SkfB family radical SAM enzyme
MKRFNLVGVCSTTRCTGKCFCCIRRTLKNNMKKIDLDLDILHPLLSNIDYLSFNGIYGDVIHNPKIFQFVEKCQDYENLFLEIATSGDKKNDTFWSELGKLKVKVIFGIDGLEDTHHIYRGTPYNEIINNMKLFIDNGGYAVWQFITFEYNYHQIKKAHDLSVKMGCKEFIFIRSSCYNEKYRRPRKDIISRDEMFKLSDKAGKYCFWGFREGKPFNSIYVDVSGYVHPCVNAATFTYPLTLFDSPDYDQLRPIFLANKDKLNLYNNDISDILRNPYIKHIKDNKDNINICTDTCYGKYTNIDDDFKPDKPKDIREIDIRELR